MSAASQHTHQAEDEASFGYFPGLEYEELPPENGADSHGRKESCMNDDQETERAAANPKLLFLFIIMVLTGASNLVFFKLQAIPMYNYPNFINLFGNFLYIPIMFAYIIPVSKYGFFDNAISEAQIRMPKRPFAVMGCLDCLSCMMQIFSSIYLPGPLLVLLPQSAIPISMVLSKQILGQRYRLVQYVGAAVVLGGILVVLEPLLTHRHSPDNICQAIDLEEDCTVCQVETTEEDCLSHRLPIDNSSVIEFANYLLTVGSSDSTSEGILCEWIETQTASTREEELLLIWSLVSILSCVPMALSSIYKEIAMNQEGLELDPIYLNGWVAIFQFLFSVLLAVPAGMASSPPVQPMDLPSNIFNGLKCYLGWGSIDMGCHPDDYCASHASLLVNLCLAINVVYTLSYTLILKYGSANLMYLASTAIIPIGNFAFALPFMPQATTFHFSDIFGLCVIMAGLVFYRFGDVSNDKARESSTQELADVSATTRDDSSLRDPLLGRELF